MQPEQPQQYPYNYLDSIAPQPQPKRMNPIALWALIGGVLLLAIIVVFAIAGAGSSRTDDLTRYGYQMNELKTLSQEAQENIKSSELRTANSSLMLVLTNANRELQAPLAAQEIDVTKTDTTEAKAVTAEITELKDRLEDARLNGLYDRRYAREMSFILKSLQADMTVLYDKTRSEELQKVLAETFESLAALEESFTEFNDA